LSQLLDRDGRPIRPAVGEDGKQNPKQPPQEALDMMLQLADMVLMVEAKAFTHAEGHIGMKILAAHNAWAIARRPLSREEFKSGTKRVWLAPHLFGIVELAVAPPAPSNIKLLCRDIRAQFTVLQSDGYQGIPILGLGPLHFLKQIESDLKKARAAGKHVGPIKDTTKAEKEG